MNLLKAYNIAQDLMKQHNLTEWKFEFDNARKRFGVCKYSTKTISLSRELTLLNSEDEVVDTILHEIAHALAGRKAGHGKDWKRVAVEIGCTGERCYDTSQIVQPRPRWIGFCVNNHMHTRERRPSGRASCSLCCSYFNPEYVIAWKKNI